MEGNRNKWKEKALGFAYEFDQEGEGRWMSFLSC